MQLIQLLALLLIACLASAFPTTDISPALDARSAAFPYIVSTSDPNCHYKPTVKHPGVFLRYSCVPFHADWSHVQIVWGSGLGQVLTVFTSHDCRPASPSVPGSWRTVVQGQKNQVSCVPKGQFQGSNKWGSVLLSRPPFSDYTAPGYTSNPPRAIEPRSDSDSIAYIAYTSKLQCHYTPTVKQPGVYLKYSCVPFQVSASASHIQIVWGPAFHHSLTVYESQDCSGKSWVKIAQGPKNKVSCVPKINPFIPSYKWGSVLMARPSLSPGLEPPGYKRDTSLAIDAREATLPYAYIASTSKSDCRGKPTQNHPAIILDYRCIAFQPEASHVQIGWGPHFYQDIRVFKSHDCTGQSWARLSQGPKNTVSCEPAKPLSYNPKYKWGSVLMERAPAAAPGSKLLYIAPGYSYD